MLKEREFEAFHTATVQILEEVGFHVPDDQVLALLEKAGLKVEKTQQCIKFAPHQITDAIQRVPKEVRLYHRGTGADILLGGETRFMPSGTGIAIFDLSTGHRRDTRTSDVRDLLRLQDVLKHLDVARPVVTALEFNENSDLVECYLALCHTGKPFLHRTLNEKNAVMLVRMLTRVMEGEENLRQRPPFVAVYCPKSPLSLTPDSVRCMLTFAAAGIPILILSMAMGGATAPVTLHGLALLVNAEVLAGITMIQTLYPDTPVLYGSVASILDMRTAILALGAPERGILNGLCAEIARRYQIPSVMGGLSTDAKELDEQAGFEKALTLWPLMGKADLVFGMGVMDSAGTYSFEQLVLDNEMIGAMKRLCQEIDSTLLPEELSLIKQIGWSGEYLSAEYTLAHFRSHWQPELMTRTSFPIWQQKGKTLAATTRERIVKRLAGDFPLYIDPATDQDLRRLLLDHGVVLPNIL